MSKFAGSFQIIGTMPSNLYVYSQCEINSTLIDTLICLFSLLNVASINWTFKKMYVHKGLFSSWQFKVVFVFFHFVLGYTFVLIEPRDNVICFLCLVLSKSRLNVTSFLAGKLEGQLFLKIISRSLSLHVYLEGCSWNSKNFDYFLMHLWSVL